MDSSGYVWLVGAGPGDPDLITVRGWRALREADVVLYDSLVDASLLDGLSAARVYVGKRCGAHAMPQERIADLLARLALQGKRVVRLKGGDPSVLGRVGEEAARLAELGVPYEIVPGVTSATAVPALAGIPVTHRSVADSFVVATAHRRGDAAGSSIPPYSARTTLVLLMPRATVRSWAQQLREQGYPEGLPVAFVSEGCTPRQQVLETTVAEAADALESSGLPTPLLAVVGRVVGLRAKLAAGAQGPRGAGDAAMACEEALPFADATLSVAADPLFGAGA